MSLKKVNEQEKENKYDVLILYSGGADSRLMSILSEQSKMKPYFLMIDYGQKHINELEYATSQLLDEIKIDKDSYQLVKITNLKIDSALTGNGEKSQYENTSMYHVPGRNTMFLSIALSIAESKNIPTIWIGCDWSDYLGNFIDCFQSYISKINELAKFSSSKEIKIEAPLMGMSKELVIQLLSSFGVIKESIYSGYGEHS